jgi:hypothetical protein
LQNAKAIANGKALCGEMIIFEASIRMAVAARSFFAMQKTAADS